MRTAAWAQLRANIPRLVAAGIAIVLSVGFIVATLALSTTFTATMKTALSSSIANADATIDLSNIDLGSHKTTAEAQSAEADAVLPALRSADHVEQAEFVRHTSAQIAFGGKRSYATIDELPAGSLRAQKLSSGAWPAAPGQVAVDETSAGLEKLSLGDELTLTISTYDAAKDTYADVEHPVTISGLIAGANSALSSGTMQIAMTSAGIDALESADAGGSIQIAGDGASQDAVASSVRAALPDGGPSLTVQTRDQVVADQLQQLTGSTNLLTTLILVFAVVSLFVAGIVIANTFHVLVARRTRELALLRCIGASTAQVSRSVLLEALVLGVAASILGVLAGYGLAGGIAAWTRGADLGIQLDAVSVGAWTIVAGLVVGVLATFLSALAPARRATRVLPLAALRPADDVAVASRRGLVRLIIAAVLVLGGAAGLIYGASAAGILVALPSGLACFIGILLASSLLIPWAVRGFGALVGWTGVTGRLAALNSVRNPGRTAATAAALLIGVTLVSMMMVGSASVRATVQNEIDGRKPIDLIVSNGEGKALGDADIHTVRGLPGVASSAELGGLRASVAPADGAPVGSTADDGSVSSNPDDIGEVQLSIVGLDASVAAPVTHSSIRTPKQGELLLNPFSAGNVKAGEKATVAADGGRTATFTVALSPQVPEGTGQLRPDDLKSLDGGAQVTELWLKLDAGLSNAEVQSLQTKILSADDALVVDGGAAERAFFGQILDTMLLIVLCLLAIAVIIALVGVANTMALSVLERRRESALLRALGLTKGQLRGMLAIEAVLVAGVAAVLGVVLGGFFGWSGTASIVLDTDLPATLSVPWGQIAGVVGIAALAGLLASVLPARNATRVSPVEGLAVD